MRIDRKENIPLHSKSHNIPVSIHNTATQLACSSSPPSFRSLPGNHLNSLWGTRTCWQSRNWCIWAFSLYTALHGLTSITYSRKCRLRQLIYHLSGVFHSGKQLTILRINPGLLYIVCWPLKKNLNCDLSSSYTFQLDSWLFIFNCCFISWLVFNSFSPNILWGTSGELATLNAEEAVSLPL